jgi:hypothetical protein
MLFNPSGLAYAFEAQGELGFTYWTYATNDGIGDVLVPEYFASMCRRMRVGDMVLVGTRPRPEGSPWRNATGEVRRALLMVGAVDPGGSVRVRLVQDYGRADDPDAELGETPRRRGRPRKEGGAGAAGG